MSFQNEKPFSIHVLGEVTGETYAGDFVAYKFLSSRLVFKKDQLLRSYLAGENPLISGQVDRADKFSVVQSCLAETPAWWKENGVGLDMLDFNVVEEVYTNIKRIQDEAVEALKAKASKAAPELPKLAAKAEEKAQAEVK